jgi:hypothetical protein
VRTRLATGRQVAGLAAVAAVVVLVVALRSATGASSF